MDYIEIRGARTHNLKNINLRIPRDKLIVMTGLSGSGKSSLAFDTLYAEGHRRYVESLSVYARQFLSLIEKPDVDHIEGLSPSISIEQKSTSHNPRSTVGTITEIHDYLRLLFSRIGEPRCPDHNMPLTAYNVSQMVDAVLTQPNNHRMMLLAPIFKDRKGDHLAVLNNLASQGYVRARINGKVCELSNLPILELQKKHTIEIVVDRFKIRHDIARRLSESFETALQLSCGIALLVDMDNPTAKELLFSSNFVCVVCGYNMVKLEPRLFSFNNPTGACSNCDGLGVQQFFDSVKVVHNTGISLYDGAIHGWDHSNFYYFQMLQSLAEHYKFNIDAPYATLTPEIQHTILHGSGKEIIKFKYYNNRGDVTVRHHPFSGVINNMERRYKETESETTRESFSKYISNRPCLTCHGTRLCKEARFVFIENTTLPEIVDYNIDYAVKFFQNLQLNGQRAQIASTVLKEISVRLKFLVNVGLNYLTLSRSVYTLSGGEAQRIRLASQIGTALVGVMYVLDEPSIGLHQRDNHLLLETLVYLRNLGNTIIVVEHDEDAIRAADHLIDLGPRAGVHGGEIVAQGTLDDIISNPASLTGQFLSGKRRIDVPETRTPINKNKILQVIGATGNNLKNVTLKIPVGLFTCITGVSGSGKSTLINNTLFPIAQQKLNRMITTTPLSYVDVEGLEYFDKVIDINQSPIGRTPRSNPATYTGVFTPIRELFSSVPESRTRGYNPGRFSFNIKGGRCETCQGDGVIKVSMHFLPDVYVPCDQCKNKRYNRETLEIKYKGKNIYEVLNMTIEEAREFFASVPVLTYKIQRLIDVGLSYICLGQSAITLSGGEAQRVKLARELSKRGTGQTIYIFDEPTIGLHCFDIQQLLTVLYQLRAKGNTIVVIEHNLDVIKTADWIIDLGPEGGDGGGEILISGTPEEVVECERSHTARFLKPILQRGY
ncbi:UvrABC system protein A [Candidatus Hartigia pinicola]|nr:UvrABC system protein A [Candidatus Hartigia pinicola]